MHDVMTDRELEDFAVAYYTAYDFLYDNDVNLSNYRELVDFGDSLLRDEWVIVKQFNEYRLDILSSDREVASFGIAYKHYLLDSE